jgi:hypothetical protein
MKNKKVVVDCINTIFIVWSLITIFTIGLHVTFSIIGKATNIPTFITSFYHIFILATIGAMMPKSDKRELLTASILTTIFLAVTVLTLLRGDTIAFSLGALFFVFVLLNQYIDYKRGG